MKASQLPAVRIALDRYGQRGESARFPRRAHFLSEQDKARTRSHDRHTTLDVLTQRVEHTEFTQKLRLYGRLTARQHEPIE